MYALRRRLIDGTWIIEPSRFRWIATAAVHRNVLGFDGETREVIELDNHGQCWRVLPEDTCLGRLVSWVCGTGLPDR